MKKLLLSLVVSIGLVLPISIASPNTEAMTETVNKLIKSEPLYGVTISEFHINDNSNKDGKIAILDLKWDELNSAATTRQMLQMYSARIVVKALGQDNDIQEAVLLWEVPYHKEGSTIAKFSYFKKNGEFYSNGEWFQPPL